MYVSWIVLDICNIYFSVYPHVIKGKYVQYVEVEALDSFTLSMEFIFVCNEFTITWQFKGRNITIGTNHVTNVQTVKRFHYKASLIVAQCSISDNGTYTVIVTSDTGNVRVNSIVKVLQSKLLCM